ncbi:RebB family R body protein [Mameliella sp.]|uniref:RebB family R body protein n=1 Tax=Mameliella sp. TaxID=1924940 RepID=UPI003B50F772
MTETANPQITDAVSQSNLSVLGQAAAQAVAASFQASSNAAGLRAMALQSGSSNMTLLRQAVVVRATAGLTP